MTPDDPAQDAGAMPQEAKDLWAAAHIASIRWREVQEHPTCPHVRAQMNGAMKQLQAAATRVETVMDALNS